MDFQIKICGVTSVADALLAANCGADAIGLNFYSESPRHVPLDIAQNIVDDLPGQVRRVGVFVNEEVDAVMRRFDLLGLDFAQLHGDEPAATLFALGERPTIRAFRWSTHQGVTSEQMIDSFLEQCENQRRSPAAILVDAHVPGTFGGTGARADWNAVAAFRENHPEVRLILAGGLKPENVREALATVRPDAVDVASGVERHPGRKDPELVRAFIDQVRFFV